MKVRYCRTKLEKLCPCDSGRGGAGGEMVKWCHDEPMEENCRRIVDTEDAAICPYCGTAMGVIGDFLIDSEPPSDVVGNSGDS